VQSGGGDGCGRRSGEVHLGKRLAGKPGWQCGAVGLEEATVEVERFAVPHTLEDIEELGRPGVAIVVVDFVAPPQLRRSASTTDDVVNQTSAGCSLQTGRHPRCLYRVKEPRLERNHETVGGGLGGQRCCGRPRILGHRERRQKSTEEPCGLGSLCHRCHVVDVAVSVQFAAADRGSNVARPVSTGIAAVVATRSTQRRVVAFHPDPPIEIDAHAVAFSSVVAFSSLRIRPSGSTRCRRCSPARCSSSMCGRPDKTKPSTPISRYDDNRCATSS